MKGQYSVSKVSDYLSLSLSLALSLSQRVLMNEFIPDLFLVKNYWDPR